MRSPRKALSKLPTYSQCGLDGYAYPLDTEQVEAYLVEVRQGHDDYIVSRVCTHIYHVIDGKGSFTVDGKRYEAGPGMLFEIPPGIEFTFSGTMRLLLVMTPPWFEGNAKVTRRNPDVG